MNKVCIKPLIVGSIMLSFIVACTQPERGYIIHGEIADTQSGTIYLKRYEDKSFSDVDSALIQNGLFEFKGKVGEEQAYALTTFKESRQPLLFFMGNDEMTIRLNESEKKIDVKGSVSHDLYATNAPLIRQDGYNLDSLIALHPASPVGAYFVVRDFAWQLSLNELKAKRTKFDVALQGSFYLNQLDSLISKLASIQVGQIAPDFTLSDNQNTPVSLSSFRGKYVLVDFWASWCPDCRRENPAVVALYNQYKEKNFTVLGVSLDRNRDAWLKAIEKDGLTWTQVSDIKGWQCAVARRYAIRWIPTSFLLDPDGRILLQTTDVKETEAKLTEIFK